MHYWDQLDIYFRFSWFFVNTIRFIFSILCGFLASKFLGVCINCIA